SCRFPERRSDNRFGGEGRRPGLKPRIDYVMSNESNQLDAPTIGIITALSKESAALCALLGDPEEEFVSGGGAGRRYWRAEVPSLKGGVHRVVVAQAGVGTNIAAIRADLLLQHFPVVFPTPRNPRNTSGLETLSSRTSKVSSNTISS